MWKSKHSQSINADELTLHLVLIRNDGNLTSELSGKKFESGEALWPTKKLSGVFPNGAVEDHLHIMVLKLSAF